MKITREIHANKLSFVAIITAFLAIGLCNTVVFAEEMTPYQQILKDLDATHTLFNQGRYEEAAFNYNDIIDRGLTGANIYFSLAQSYRMLGLYQNAIKYYELALRISPDFSDAYFELARTFEALKDSALADKNYRYALDKGKPSDITYANYGFFLLASNPPQISTAQRLVAEGYSMYPENPHIKYLDAKILYHTAQHESAWELIEDLRIKDYDGIEPSFIESLATNMPDPYRQTSVKRRIKRLEERQNIYWLTKSIDSATRSYANNERPQ